MISKRVLFERAARFPDAKAAVYNWHQIAISARWLSLEDIRRQVSSVDMVGGLAIFNIKGNHYRLIVRVVFRTQRLYIKEFLTHAEYDRKAWMKWL